MASSLSKKKKLAHSIYTVLNENFPDAKCSLVYSTPLELLVATQLAAQCTDARVNIVTKDLFAKYKTAEDYAKVDLSELENDIRSTGFFRNKARNIKACCQILQEKYEGSVPKKMEDLLALPGVGRKTANVVRGEAFDLPGIVIDTHAGRISRKLGLTCQEDPVKVEFELMELLPEDTWMKFCHCLIELGRSCCTARKQDCVNCCLKDYCISSTHK